MEYGGRGPTYGWVGNSPDSASQVANCRFESGLDGRLKEVSGKGVGCRVVGIADWGILDCGSRIEMQRCVKRSA